MARGLPRTSQPHRYHATPALLVRRLPICDRASPSSGSITPSEPIGQLPCLATRNVEVTWFERVRPSPSGGASIGGDAPLSEIEQEPGGSGRVCSGMDL